VPVFIDRGAPVRNTLSTPITADFPMQAIKPPRQIASHNFGELR
jgi:hypothetical protein